MKYLKVKEEEKADSPTRIRSIDRLMSLNEFDEIEMKFYEKFKDACYKYFEDKYIDDLVKDYIRSYLMLKTYSTSLTSKTKIGSIYIGSEILRDIQNELQVDLNIATKVYTAMMASGLCLFDCIIPAPFLEEKFLAYLTPPKKLPDLTNGSKIVKKLEEISERLEMLVKDLREIIKLLK